jgi:hypothetical protein
MVDYKKLDEIEVDNVSGYPDFADAYICRATYDDGSELTEDELDELNEDSDFVYQVASKNYKS